MAKTTMGERIRALRKQKGMTIEQLAKRTYASSRTIIGDYERGKRGMKRPNIALVIRIAKVLDTSIDYLLLGSEEDTKKR